MREAFDYYLKQAAESGFTAYHEMGMVTPEEKGGWKGYEILLEKEREGKLPLRTVGVCHKLGGGDDTLGEYLPSKPFKRSTASREGTTARHGKRCTGDVQR